MKTLKFSKIHFTVLGIHTFEWIINPYDRILKTFSICFFLISLVLVSASAAAYIHNNLIVLSQLSNVLMALVLTIGSFGCAASYISVVIKKHKLDTLSSEVQTIFDKGTRKRIKCENCCEVIR